MNILGKCLNQRYRVVAKLGEGGMGVVFQARDVNLDRFVAVKVLQPTYCGSVALERLRREIEIQARVEHANVVRLYDAGCDRLNYFVMEYVEGSDLGMLQREGTLREQLHAVAQAAAGLARAHAHGVVHRDLKPQNILVSIHGEAKVSDFGLSCVLGTEDRVTRENSTVGSVHYMAPEQCRGANVGQSADLYALGVILYQCATRRLPFIGKRDELLTQHLHGRVQPPREFAPGIPEELETLILRLVEKEPGKRPASADVVRTEIDRLLRAHWPMSAGDDSQMSLGAAVRRIARAGQCEADVFVPADTSVVCGGSSTNSVLDGRARFSVRCTQCSALLRLRREDAKKLIGCPVCRNRFRVAPLTHATDIPRTHRVDSSKVLNVHSDSPRDIYSSHGSGAEFAGEVCGLDELAEEHAPIPRMRRGQWHPPLPSRALAIRTSSVVAVALLVLVAVLAAKSGVPQLLRSQVSKDQPPRARAPVLVDRGRGPSLPTVQQQYSVEIETNWPGAMISVNGPTGDRNVLTYEGKQFRFQTRETGEHQFHAELGGAKKTLTWRTGESGPVRLFFDHLQIKRICQAAVCLIRMPDEGHGTGFLLGDRQMVVTAAHILVTHELDKIEFIFELDGDREERISGARLVYFDAAQDVALLQLSQPIQGDRPHLRPGDLQSAPMDQGRVLMPGQPGMSVGQGPMFSGSGGQVATPSRVFVIGNPSSGDDFDPLQLREANVTAQRPDEIELNIELKPGHSGGPVCRTDSGEVVGLVSYKIASATRFEDIGRSFAKSIGIASDAHRQWSELTDTEKQRRIHRIEGRFARTIGYRRAFWAALNLSVDGIVYAWFCQLVVEDYREYMRNVQATIPHGASHLQIRQIEINAHRKYIKEELPRASKRVRDRITPRLRPETDKWYARAMADDTLPKALAADLKDAHDHYQKLKSAAEKLGSVGPEEGMTAEQFERALREWERDLVEGAGEVIVTCQEKLAPE